MQNDGHAGSGLPIGLALYLREFELALRWRHVGADAQRSPQAGKVPRYLRLGGRVLYPIAMSSPSRRARSLATPGRCGR